MKWLLLLGFENNQPDTAAVSLVYRSMRAAVTVAGRVNKQGPVSGTGAATVKVASLVTAPKCFTYSTRLSQEAKRAAAQSRNFGLCQWCNFGGISENKG